MARITKRSALEKLTKARLVEIADRFGLDIDSMEKKTTFVEALRKSRKSSYERVLGLLDHEELRAIVDAHGLKSGDADAGALRNTILGKKKSDKNKKRITRIKPIT